MSCVNLLTLVYHATLVLSAACTSFLQRGRHTGDELFQPCGAHSKLKFRSGKSCRCPLCNPPGHTPGALSANSSPHEKMPPNPLQGRWHSPTCTVTLAESRLHSPACAVPLAQSRLHSPACTVPLAQSHLHSPACTVPLAQSRLRTPTCVHSHSPACTVPHDQQKTKQNGRPALLVRCSQWDRAKRDRDL